MSDGVEGLCVVLNNQHEVRVDEFVAINAADAGRPVLFQPYTDDHLRALRTLLDRFGQPVPLFLVTGRFGDSVSAVGLLDGLEYLDDMTPGRKAELSRWASKYDEDPVYARNILIARNLTRLRSAIPLGHFIKSSNGAPLVAGSWTASICRVPELAEVIAAI